MKNVLILFVLIMGFTSANAQTYIYNPAPYCNFRPSFVGLDYLTNFKLNTINRSLPPSDTGAYFYYSSGVTTTLNVGASYPVTIQYFKPDAEYMVVSVFIDYNHNNVFDSDEVAYNHNNISGNSTSAVFTINGSITIPLTALTGETRLRVMIMDPNDTAGITGNPCAYSASSSGGSPYYGDAVDFNVTIADTMRAEVSVLNKGTTNMIYPNPAVNYAYIDNSFVGSDIAITDIQGRMVSNGKLKNNQVDVSALSPGLYIIRITNVNQTYVQRLFVEK